MEVRFAPRRLVVVVGVVEDDRLAAEHQQVTAIGRGEDVRIEDERCRTVSHDPPVDRCDLLEALSGASQVVGRRDDGLAPARFCLEEVRQESLFGAE